MRRLSLLGLMAAFGVLQLAFVGQKQTPQDVTYSEHIAPILWEKCLPCHREGGMAPFGLTTYEDVKKRHALIRQVAMTRQMPPTDATSQLARIVTEAPLTDEETVLIQQWVRQGLKEGFPTAPPKIPVGIWRLGQPDSPSRVMESFLVKAEGNPLKEIAVLPTSFADPTRLRAFDVRPVEPQGVRFVRLAYRQGSQKQSPFMANGVDPKQLIGTWAPGYHAWRMPEGASLEIPAGAQLVMEVTYQPGGRPQKGAIDVGFYWGKATDAKPIMRTLGNREFVLPNDTITTLADSWTLETDIDLSAIYPEARELARQIRLTAHVPREAPKDVLLVHSYDPAWMGSYVFDKAIRLKKGTRLVLEMEYDNTTHAGRLTKPVRYGPLETDELFWMHLQYVPVTTP